MENPMSNELSAKIQAALWWITSIAVSVLCCSILFVVFASHLSDVKSAVRDNNERIAIIQEREDRILAEIDLIRRHMVVQNVPTPAAPAPDASAPTIPEPTPGGPLPVNPPDKETSAAAPAAEQPLPTPASAPAPAAASPVAPVPAPAAPAPAK